MKINAATPKDVNLKLYMAFSSIPLDIEGSNIDFVGWIPSEEDKKYMQDDDYEMNRKKGVEQKAKVLFKNVKTKWESCDCGGDYPCNHGDYVYAIEIHNEDNIHKVDIELEYICFNNNRKYGSLPISSVSVFDFIRMCQLCEIEVELSEYAVSLLSLVCV